jgi:biopolymer transport protein ExbB
MNPLGAITFASDSLFGTAFSFFQRGGMVMWPLLLCSLIAVAMAIERLLHFWHERMAEALTAKTVGRVLDALVEGRFAEAETLVAQAPSASCRILAEGLRQRDVALQDSLTAAAEREIGNLRQGLSILDTIITLAPLLGILGTVTGIIRSFNLLSTGGIQDPTAVTGGIAEALITTAAGLIVSICTLIPFNYCGSFVRRRTRAFEQLIHRVVIACERGKAHGA